MADAKSDKAVTLEQLGALNQEIAALMRAGVPLESGLKSLGGELPRDLGRVTAALAERLSSGQSLEQALDAAGSGLPVVYKAVMKAALRSHRPAAALEALASALSRLVAMRRSVFSAMIYPILVAVAAWLGFVLYVSLIGPKTWELFADFGLGGGAIDTIRVVAEWCARWGFIVPLGLFGATAAWWFQTGRAGFVEPLISRFLFGWIPFVGRLRRNTQAAAFLDILTLLIESRVPFEEAMRLAAEATGNPKTVRSAAILVERMQAGRRLSAEEFTHAGFPPMFAWLLVGGAARGDLLPSLKHARETYHRRAEFNIEAIRGVVPVVCTGIIGGIVAAAFVLAVYVPYVNLLLNLS